MLRFVGTVGLRQVVGFLRGVCIRCIVTFMHGDQPQSVIDLEDVGVVDYIDTLSDIESVGTL